MKFLALLGILFLSVPVLAEDLPKTIVGKDGVEMVLIPAGKFIMGSDDRDLKETAPKHKVYIDSFYMDRYEITNGQFAKFLNAVRPSEGKLGERWRWVVIRNDLETDERKNWWPTEIIYEDGMYKALEGYESFPVLSVSWYAADKYCRWVGERLPTEAEWEKAARGGLKGKRFPWGNELPTDGIVFDRRWYSNDVPPPTERVGSYHPNGYGLYDMAGNVWEWCSDWYHPYYYKESPKKNPQGPPTGSKKVLRGGSWYNSAYVLRVAFRNYSSPHSKDDGVGFRCVMDINRKDKNDE
jgi:formylglycine-generating enzyme required for sulfatase activity